jgi:hypothetical protein
MPMARIVIDARVIAWERDQWGVAVRYDDHTGEACGRSAIGRAGSGSAQAWRRAPAFRLTVLAGFDR